jgi:hypothetical protein
MGLDYRDTIVKYEVKRGLSTAFGSRLTSLKMTIKWGRDETIEERTLKAIGAAKAASLKPRAESQKPNT